MALSSWWSSAHCGVALRKQEEFHIDDLPCEILIHIFLSLPLKSLVRAKCTCKLWYTMMSDPKFAEMQFNRAVKNPGHIYRLTASERNIYFVERVSNNDIDIEATKISYEDTEEDGCYFYSSESYSAGGLMAYLSEPEECCYICNPIIKEQIKVPMGRFFSHSYEIEWWGFGYTTTTTTWSNTTTSASTSTSTSTKEYKIVVFGSTKLILSGAIYTLGSESWRDIIKINPRLIPFPPHHEHEHKHVDCDGTFFWLIYQNGSNDDVFQEDEEETNIGSFDIRSEEFRGWRGPYSEMRGEMSGEDAGRLGPFLLMLGDTVACVRRKGINYTIWTLRDKVNEVWVKEYNFTPSNSSPIWSVKLIGLWMNCDLLGYSHCIRFSPSRPVRSNVRTCVTYDTNTREFREISLPFAEKNLDGSPIEPHVIFSHVGCLISPSRIVAMAKENSSSVG